MKIRSPVIINESKIADTKEGPVLIKKYLLAIAFKTSHTIQYEKKIVDAT